MSTRIAVIRMINESQYITVDENGRVKADDSDSLLELFKENDYVILDSPSQMFDKSTFAFEAVLDKLDNYKDISLFSKLVIYSVGYALSWSNRVSPEAFNFTKSEVDAIKKVFLDNMEKEIAKSQWYTMFCLSYSRMFRMNTDVRASLFNSLEETREKYLSGEHTLRSNHILVIGMGGYVSYSGECFGTSIDDSSLDEYYINKDKFQYVRIRLDLDDKDSITKLISHVVYRFDYELTPMKFSKDNNGYIIDFMLGQGLAIDRVQEVVYQEQVNGEVYISPIDFSSYMS